MQSKQQFCNFTFPHYLARGHSCAGDSNRVCADGCIDPISAGADLQSNSYFHRRRIGGNPALV